MDDMDSYNLGFLQFHSLMSEHICSRDLSPIRKQIYSPSKCRKGEKNAQELINEEQKAKLKAEKKKAKKERQKQKRKELNESHSVTIDNSETIINKASNKMDNLTLNSDKNFEGLDMKAAFLSKAVKRVKNSMVVSEMPKQKKNVIDINSIINDAIDYEKINNNEEALQLFSEAIHLAPRRFDLILKRSHLYYKLAKFEKSIQDSETVLKYIPNNVDANYRLGEAYYALNNFGYIRSSSALLIIMHRCTTFSKIATPLEHTHIIHISITICREIPHCKCQPEFFLPKETMDDVSYYTLGAL
ncbi:hypothetical protein J6590_062062 [Homalodisca vitripennis]|nr:hypothetical protein J6590_062062 [Homalodisca vitripennis]